MGNALNWPPKRSDPPPLPQGRPIRSSRVRSDRGLAASRAHLPGTRPLMMGGGLAGRRTHGRSADRASALGQARVETPTGARMRTVHMIHFRLSLSRVERMVLCCSAGPAVAPCGGSTEGGRSRGHPSGRTPSDQLVRPVPDGPANARRGRSPGTRRRRSRRRARRPLRRRRPGGTQ